MVREVVKMPNGHNLVWIWWAGDRLGSGMEDSVTSGMCNYTGPVPLQPGLTGGGRGFESTRSSVLDMLSLRRLDITSREAFWGPIGFVGL